jgi:hypothetical protein
METSIGISGLIGVLILNQLISNEYIVKKTHSRNGFSFATSS